MTRPRQTSQLLIDTSDRRIELIDIDGILAVGARRHVVDLRAAIAAAQGDAAVVDLLRTIGLMTVSYLTTPSTFLFQTIGHAVQLAAIDGISAVDLNPPSAPLYLARKDDPPPGTIGHAGSHVLPTACWAWSQKDVVGH